MSISLQMLLWLLCFAAQFALLTITFHQLLCITDLEADYVSPFEATVQINKWVMVEFLLQGLLCLYFLLSWHWFMFLLALPVTCYHAMLFMRRQHLIDVTEVFRNLNFEKKFRLVKLGFYILFFAFSIIRIIAGMLSLLYYEDLDLRSSFLEF